MNKPASLTRHLAWPDCYNARDLGGLPIPSGGETGWGAVVRSDILNRLTDDGQAALLAYGIRTIIDLRAPQEVTEFPSRFTPQNAPDYGLACLNLPLEKYYPHVGALIKKATTRAEVYTLVLDHYPDAVAGVLGAIAEAPPGGVLIHCHAGKDRTGIVAALLLRLAGVPADIVAADYAQSQVRLRPLYEQMVAEAGGEDNMDFWLRPTATAEMMTTMLGHLDGRYGGVAPYLQAAGLSAETLDRLKRRLRPE